MASVEEVPAQVPPQRYASGGEAVVGLCAEANEVKTAGSGPIQDPEKPDQELMRGGRKERETIAEYYC